MNHKNARIEKLIRKNLSNQQIIKTIGYKDSPEINARIEKIRKQLNGE
ncbi:MAG: hypothetical protein AB7J46_06220 [Candidatus Altimarinota bacterium]